MGVNRIAIAMMAAFVLSVCLADAGEPDPLFQGVVAGDPDSVRSALNEKNVNREYHTGYGDMTPLALTAFVLLRDENQRPEDMKKRVEVARCLLRNGADPDLATLALPGMPKAGVGAYVDAFAKLIEERPSMARRRRGLLSALREFRQLLGAHGANVDRNETRMLARAMAEAKRKAVESEVLAKAHWLRVRLEGMYSDRGEYPREFSYSYEGRVRVEAYRTDGGSYSLTVRSTEMPDIAFRVSSDGGVERVK